jgi:hypothetical protein
LVGIDGFEVLGEGFWVGLVEGPFGLNEDGALCFAGVLVEGGFGAFLMGVDSGKGGNALSGRCGFPFVCRGGAAVLDCRSCSFLPDLACCTDPGSADRDALTSVGLTAVFVVVVKFGPLPDRFGVTVLFADAIPYALAGTTVTVVVVADDDDADLGASFFVSSSSLLL